MNPSPVMKAKLKSWRRVTPRALKKNKTQNYITFYTATGPDLSHHTSATLRKCKMGSFVSTDRISEFLDGTADGKKRLILDSMIKIAKVMKTNLPSTISRTTVTFSPCERERNTERYFYGRKSINVMATVRERKPLFSMISLWKHKFR